MEALTSFNFPNARHWIASCYTKCLSWYSQRLWGQLAKGELGVSTELRDKRRNEWQQTTRSIIRKVFTDAEKKFAKTIKLYVWDPDDKYPDGFKLINKESFSLSTGPEITEICAVTTDPLKEKRPRHLSERMGEILIGQDESGLIHICFFPVTVDTEGANMPPRQYLIYGRYEPWDLTEAELQLVVFRGVRFLLESRTGSRPSWYSRWLHIKNSVFYKGIILGVVLGWAGSLIAALAGCIWTWLVGGIATIAYGIWAWACRG